MPIERKLNKFSLQFYVLLTNFVFFRKDQEAVYCETNEVSSLQFIGYRLPLPEQNVYAVLFSRHQSTKVCQAFRWVV